MSAMTDTPGIHGKLPSHGDFITRRLSRNFVDEWDDWLQRAISASKTELGERWLDVYLISPIWSFVLEAGICGANAWAGVLMPSVDRVGRYFPLTLAAPVSPALSPAEIAVQGNDWFGRARSLALSSLEQENFSLDEFDAAVSGLGLPTPSDAATENKLIVEEISVPRGLCLPLALAGDPESGLMQLAHALIKHRLGRYSLWWPAGSEPVPPCLLVAPNLPAPAAYRALLDGRFSADHWLMIAPARNDSTNAGAQA